ncbi:helix-turn-helix domain-containing protein [Cellulomonas sp. Marseille-Q8402]
MTSEQPGRVRFLTVAEVAEVMRVSKMTVYRLLHSGEMPAVRVGRSFRVPQDALDHYLSTARLDLETGADGDEGPRAGRLSS